MSTKLTSIQFLPTGLHSYTILKEYIEDVIIANPKIIVYDISADAVSDLKRYITIPTKTFVWDGFAWIPLCDLAGNFTDSTMNIQATTRQYVDDATTSISGATTSISGTMRIIGTSTAAITNGGKELPIISGNRVTPSSGDAVFYNDVEALSDILYTEGNGYIEIKTKPKLAIEAILTISSVEHNFPQFIAIKDDDTYVVGLEFTKGHIKTGTIDNPVKYVYTKNHLVRNS